MRAELYLAKEMVRRLFASQEVAEAYAWKDMILEHFQRHPEVAKTFNGTSALLRNHFDRCIAYPELNLRYKTNNFTEKVMRKLRKIGKIRYHLRTPESRLRHSPKSESAAQSPYALSLDSSDPRLPFSPERGGGGGSV